MRQKKLPHQQTANGRIKVGLPGELATYAADDVEGHPDATMAKQNRILAG
jgi:hypothetical protein